jgi:hypothetical protein
MIVSIVVFDANFDDSLSREDESHCRARGISKSLPSVRFRAHDRAGAA